MRWLIGLLSRDVVILTKKTLSPITNDTRKMFPWTLARIFNYKFLAFFLCFVLMLGLFGIAKGDPVRWENYPVENSIYTVFYADCWNGQTFTVYGTNHNVTSVKLQVRRIGNPSGNMTVGIRATTNELPSGADLTNSTVLCSDISTTKTLNEFSMSPIIEVTAQTLYAIVVRCPESNATNRIQMYGRTNPAPSGTPYEGGDFVMSYDGGASWQKENYYFDHWFEIWGEGNSSVEVETALYTILINNTDSNVVLDATFQESPYSRTLEFKTANNFYVDVGTYGNPDFIYVDDIARDWTYDKDLQRLNLTSRKRSGAYLHSTVEIQFEPPQTKPSGTTPSYPSYHPSEEEVEIDLPIAPPFRVNRVGLLIIAGGVGIFGVSALYAKVKAPSRRKPRGVQRRAPTRKIPRPRQPKAKVPRKPRRSPRTGRFVKS